jgi:hypothetical protein
LVHHHLACAAGQCSDKYSGDTQEYVNFQTWV